MLSDANYTMAEIFIEATSLHCNYVLHYIRIIQIQFKNLIVKATASETTADLIVSNHLDQIRFGRKRLCSAIHLIDVPGKKTAVSDTSLACTLLVSARGTVYEGISEMWVSGNSSASN